MFHVSNYYYYINVECNLLSIYYRYLYNITYVTTTAIYGKSL